MNYQWCEKIDNKLIIFPSQRHEMKLFFTETSFWWILIQLFYYSGSLKQNGFDPINQVCVFVTRQIFSWQHTHTQNVSCASFFHQFIFRKCTCRKNEKKAKNVGNSQDTFHVRNWLNYESPWSGKDVKHFCLQVRGVLKPEARNH